MAPTCRSKQSHCDRLHGGQPGGWAPHEFIGRVGPINTALALAMTGVLGRFVGRMLSSVSGGTTQPRTPGLY